MSIARSSISGTLAVLFWLTASCSSTIETRVDADPTADLGGYSSYAWSERPGPTAAVGRAVLDAELDAQIRTAADSGFAAMGWRKVDRSEAELIIHDDAGVQTEVEGHHPYHSGYAASEREYGLIALELVDAGSRERLWSGQARSALRVSARGAGVYRLQFEPTNEARMWEIEASVGKIIDRLKAAR